MTKLIETPQGSSERSDRWTSWSDEELLYRYRHEQDRTAFTELVRRYERELYSYLRRYLGDDTLAEDAFQATFLQVHLKCDRFEEGRKIRPWLYTIAVNQAIDAQRRNKRHRSVSLDRSSSGNHDQEVGPLVELLVSHEPDPELSLENAQQQEWVRKAVAELPESLRVVLDLVYFQGLKYREAAEALDIPVGTVKSRMHSAIVELNAAWRRQSPFPAE